MMTMQIDGEASQMRSSSRDDRLERSSAPQYLKIKRKLHTHLTNQLDQSDLIFSIIKEIAFLVNEYNVSNEEVRSFEGIMKKLYEVGKFISDDTFETIQYLQQHEQDDTDSADQ